MKLLKIILLLFLFTQSYADEKEFITTLYQNILLRSPDKNGLEYYEKSLKEGKSATFVAKIFFDSKEFEDQNLSDEEYIKRLYKTLLNRKEDKSGFEYWKTELENKRVSKNTLFYKFAFSDEFYSLCHSYGIKAYDKEDLKEAFVERFYSYILQRESDKEGLLYWKEKISDKQNAKNSALFFLTGKEFTAKNLNNDEFIFILYRTLLDREAETAGVEYWRGELKKQSREDIIKRFINTDEFNNLIEETLNKKFWYAPFKDTSWQLQLQGILKTDYDVDVYYIDLFDTSKSAIDKLHDQGRKVMCYFSAGSYENWREDTKEFKKEELGKTLDGWEDEKWLDIRSKNVLNIMKKRLDLASLKGCDGVEADNVNGYTNDTGFELTYNDQLSYNKALAKYAHKKGLFIALKNDLDQIKDLVNSFDLAVNEQCFEYSECELLKPFISQNKPVFHIEYNKKYINNKSQKEKMCKAALELGFETLILPLELDGSFRYDCSEYKNSFSYHIFFTDPNNPNSKKYKNGIDNNITASLNNAKESIDMAIYELSLRDITDALIDAKQRGVKVRVFTDSSHLDWDEFERLKREGVELKGDERSSLMHNKFIIIDQKETWTGSMNLTYYGVYKHNENFIRIVDKDVASVYEEEFEELFRGGYRIKNKKPQKIKRGDLEFDIYFAPEDTFLSTALLPLINSATNSIRLMIYAFTNQDITDALEKQFDRGVKIYAIFDEAQSHSRYSEYEELLNYGIAVKVDGNSYKLHNKVMIIDDNITITGSYNFTVAAEKRNDENSIVIKNRDFTAQYINEFEKLYEEAL